MATVIIKSKPKWSSMTKKKQARSTYRSQHVGSFRWIRRCEFVKVLFREFKKLGLDVNLLLGN